MSVTVEIFRLHRSEHRFGAPGHLCDKRQRRWPPTSPLMKRRRMDMESLEGHWDGVKKKTMPGESVTKSALPILVIRSDIEEAGTIEVRLGRRCLVSFQIVSDSRPPSTPNAEIPLQERPPSTGLGPSFPSAARKKNLNPKVVEAIEDLVHDLQRAPHDYRKELGEWYAIYNPKVKKSVDINLAQTFYHPS